MTNFIIKKYFLFTIIILVVGIINNNNYLINACTNLKKETKIRLLNNGYENILIALQDDISESTKLIHNIKQVFTETSNLLYNATNKRAFFKEITILVPNSWTNKNYTTLNSTWESYDVADICIETRSKSTIKEPFVVNYASECGEIGLHMHLALNYLIDLEKYEKSYGPYKNVLVQEWSYLRYGVFEEYPSPDNHGQFYFDSDGNVEAVRCSLQPKGAVRDPFMFNGSCVTYNKFGLPSDDCIFEDDIEPNNGVHRASLMYKPLVQQINSFCDNDPANQLTYHNAFAPNPQNKYCHGKSVWEVLNEHMDFKDEKNRPNEDIRYARPVFRIIKKQPKPIILMIEKSSVFSFNENYIMLKRALANYFDQMLEPGSLIGIIHFDVVSNIALEITELTDDNRDYIENHAMPTDIHTNDANYWSALKLGLIMLKNYVKERGTTMDGSRFLLITDAKLNVKHPLRHHTLETLKTNSVKVDTIALSVNADATLESIGSLTNGLSFRLSPTQIMFDVRSALLMLTNRVKSHKNRIVTIHNDLGVVTSQSSNTLNVYIDEYTSKRMNSITRFHFSFNYSKSIAHIRLYEPNTGRTFSHLETDNCVKPLLNEEINDIICDFYKPMVGLWEIRIQNPYLYTLIAHMKVTSIPQKDLSEGAFFHSGLEEQTDQIYVDAKWKYDAIDYPLMQTLYVTVRKDYRPILNAIVEVSILKPDGSIFIMELFDDGLFSDRYLNDGVYTRNFFEYVSNGPYTAHINVRTTNESRVHKYKIYNQNKMGFSFPTLGIHRLIDQQSVEPIGIFERSTLAGSFSLHRYNENKTDVIPPAKINDFEIKDIDYVQRLVTFNFTAPGNDNDYGTADLYEIVVGTDRKAVTVERDYKYKFRDYHDNTSDSTLLELDLISSTFENLKPQVSGSDETFSMSFRNVNAEIISIKIRATDELNKGEWSQVLTFNIVNQKPKLSANLRWFVKKELKADMLLPNVEKSYNIDLRMRNIIIAISITLVLMLLLSIMTIPLCIIINKRLNMMKESQSENPLLSARV